MTISKVLVVDDDMAVRGSLAQTLELADLHPITAGSFVEAKDHISAGFEGVILSDMRMPGRDGFHLLEYAQSADAELPVVLLTGEGDIPMAVRAMGQGAFGFLEKPCPSTDLLAVLQRALKTRELVLENRRLKARLEAGDAAARLLHGASDQANALRSRVRIVAQSDAEVLVNGPPGSGISKVAEVVHLCSARSGEPFVKRAAAGIQPDQFLQACEKAASGSLFIDELVTLPQVTQFVALEQIEAGIPARIIAGSSSDLAVAMDQGALLPDLYYRLDVMRIRIPALAERPEDIPVLFRHYVAQASEQAGLIAPEIGPEVVAQLMAQDWPGNARALMSAAMRFALGMGVEEDKTGSDLGLVDQMAQVERSLLLEALRRAEGRASLAAKRLKLPRKTFYDKLARYGLKPEDFR